MDKIRPWLMYLRQSRDFQGIRKRVEDLVERGGNVNNSGFAAREVLEMMRDQEIETHARTDVLNLLHRALERVPGTNKPGDEPGTHEVPRVVSERSDVFEEQVPPAAGGGAGGGSRSAREAIARRPSKADIESL